MNDEYIRGRRLALKHIREGKSEPDDITASPDFEAGYYATAWPYRAEL